MQVSAFRIMFCIYKMSEMVTKDKVLEEIDLLPEEKMGDVYNFIHHFRLGIERVKSDSVKSTLAFAGCWGDLSDDVFQEMMDDVEERRKNGFKRRRDDGIAG